MFVSVLKSLTVSELLGRTQSFTDTRTVGPSDETICAPGGRSTHLFKLANAEYSVCIAPSLCCSK